MGSNREAIIFSPTVIDPVVDIRNKKVWWKYRQAQLNLMYSKLYRHNKVVDLSCLKLTLLISKQLAKNNKERILI